MVTFQKFSIFAQRVLEPECLGTHGAKLPAPCLLQKGREHKSKVTQVQLQIVGRNGTASTMLTEDRDNRSTTMKLIIPISLFLLLMACGESKLDRGLSGAAIGAGTGAAAGAATGGSILGGGALGGAAGGAAGVLTDEDDVDLGEPVWRK
jgi:osmotically inducible lipoprotein OsmB